MPQADLCVCATVATCVDVEIETVSGVSVTHLPNLDPPCCRLGGHVLFEEYASFVADHGLVNADVSSWLEMSLELWQD